MAQRKPPRTATTYQTLAFGLLVCCLDQGSFAQALHEQLITTNRDRIESFWQAVAASNGPVTVLAFGDSLSVESRSLQTKLFDKLEARLGSAGYCFQDWPHLPAVWENGATATGTGTTNWWTSHFWLTPGSDVYWQRPGGGSVTCDEVGVFWVANASGGEFTLSVSTNGGSWSAPLLTLSGYSETQTGHYARVLLPRQPYRLRVDGGSGTNAIIGCRMRDNTSSGIETAYLAQWGVALGLTDQLLGLSTNILNPILAAINPQLVVWHMKELPDYPETVFSNNVVLMEQLWQQTVTNGDIVYIGTPYRIEDAATGQGIDGGPTVKQNRVLRDAAGRDRRVFVDCMNPCVSYEWMVSHGYLNDTLHPSNLCYANLASLLWSQLGLFALRVDRHLSIEALGPGAGSRITWPTAPGLEYDLEVSADLSLWTTLHQVAGNGEACSITNANSGAQFFRLSITETP